MWSPCPLVWGWAKLAGSMSRGVEKGNRLSAVWLLNPQSEPLNPVLGPFYNLSGFRPRYTESIGTAHISVNTPATKVPSNCPNLGRPSVSIETLISPPTPDRKSQNQLVLFPTHFLKVLFLQISRNHIFPVFGQIVGKSLQHLGRCRQWGFMVS